MSSQIEQIINDEFRWLHQNPELSMQEFKTTERLKQRLSEAGIKVLPLNLKTGLVAEIGTGDKAVAIRADIDALPIEEKTALEYKSQNCGVMHACGHDFHAAVILGAALLLKEQEKSLKGRVKAIFQPGEELPGGAKDIIDTGVLKDVKGIYGIHSIINYPVGTLVIKSGATHAAVDRFEITFTGKGTHAAHPHGGIDVIVLASQFITAAQSIVSRNSSPFSNNLLSFTHIEGGNTWNVIPETVFMQGTVRTMGEADRRMVKGKMEDLAVSIAKGFGARAEIKWVMGLPAMDNDQTLSEFATALALDDGFRVAEGRPSMGGEDFALYEELMPGAFIQIGAGDSQPNHNPEFAVDPAAIYPAARFMAHLSSAFLSHIISSH